MESKMPTQEELDRAVEALSRACEGAAQAMREFSEAAGRINTATLAAADEEAEG